MNKPVLTQMKILPETLKIPKNFLTYLNVLSGYTPHLKVLENKGCILLAHQKAIIASLGLF